jgi:hypothetical protein
MPTAICPSGHITHWRGARGFMMPATCETCGQPNSKARGQSERDDAGRVVRSWYEPVPRPPERLTVTCAACGKRRKVPSRAARQIERAATVSTGYGDWFDKTARVDAGAWVCWHHKTITEEAHT